MLVRGAWMQEQVHQLDTLGSKLLVQDSADAGDEGEVDIFAHSEESG